MSPFWMNNLILKVCFKAAHQVVSLPTAASQPSRQPWRVQIRGKKCWKTKKTLFFCQNVPQNCVKAITLCFGTIETGNRQRSFLRSAPLDGDNSDTAAKGSVLIEFKPPERGSGWNCWGFLGIPVIQGEKLRWSLSVNTQKSKPPGCAVGH